MTPPTRGEVWLADLSPMYGHEQAGKRPVVVVSDDPFNASRSGLVVVLPLTSRVRNIPLHVSVAPPEGGLTVPSSILCDAVRSVDQRRLVARWGVLNPTTMAAVDDRLRLLLRL